MAADNRHGVHPPLRGRSHWAPNPLPQHGTHRPRASSPEHTLAGPRAIN